MLQTEQNSILITDMSKCLPASALSRTPKQGCWELIDYVTKDGQAGTGIYAVPLEEAVSLELPLNATGTYKIYIGIQFTKHYTHYGSVDLKLSQDLGYTNFQMEGSNKGDDCDDERTIYTSILEMYWKTADVSGQSLQIRPRKSEISNVSYIKLVPVTEEELQFEAKLQPTESTKKVALIGLMGELGGSTRGKPMHRKTDMQWFHDEMEPYLNNDLGMIHFACIRGNLCLYRSQIGDVGTDDNSWNEEWIDPLRAFTDIAHSNGLKLFSAIRLIGAANPIIRYPINRAKFYFDHPEWAKKDKEGLPCAHPSLAYPEVRQHWLSLIRETLEYGIDGVTLILSRCAPFVMYEEPVLISFMEKHGVDPRTLEENDPLLQEHAAQYVTQFVREVRALLDEKPGRKLAILIKGYSKEVDGQVHNQSDVDTWIKEGLVDYLMPADKKPSLEYIRHWKQLGGGKVEVWPGLMPRQMTAQENIAKTEKFYEAGADGVLLWDGDNRPKRVTEWAGIRRLGHRELFDELKKDAETYFKRVPLKSIRGISTVHRFRDG